MPLLHVGIYLLSFIALWMGTQLIVSSVEKLAHRLKVTSFSISFFLLGIFTSIPEFGVGLSAIAERKPSIFVGNLIGGIPIIFFLIIPLLAIFGNGIRLNHQLTARNLLLCFVVMLAPAFLMIDHSVSTLEGIVMIALYAILFYVIQKDKGVLDSQRNNIFHVKSYSLMDILRVLLGVSIVLGGSYMVVEQTKYFATFLGIAPFYLSLFLLSIGTNLPELSLAIRSVISHTKDVAFGDYVGSAAANTFLFGFLTLLNFGSVVTTDNFFKTFLILAGGLLLFFYFTRSKHDISRREGFLLLLVYILFVIIESTTAFLF